MKKLYDALDTSTEKSLDSLASELKFPRAKVELLMYQLKQRNLVEFRQQKEIKTDITEEGEIVLQKGLPENQVLIFLVENGSEISLKDLVAETKLSKQAVNAALGQLRRAGLITINKGLISLKSKKDRIHSELEEALTKIKENNSLEIEKSIRDTLIKRKLISLKERQQTYVKLSEYGVKSKNKIVVKELVSKLTPDDIRTGKWKSLELKEYKISTQPKSIPLGRKHPYILFLEEVKLTLVGLGFSEMRGPLVESEFWNFDALFQAQDHPAREWSDVYTIKDPEDPTKVLHGKLPKDNNLVEAVKKVHETGEPVNSRGWRYKWNPEKASRLLLRPQGTAISARTLYNLKIPSKWFSIARCYRPDSVDATHLSEFNQLEGIVCDPTITFRDLLGILKTFAETVAGATKVRFKPDYYPFTSPSVELSALHPELGYIEFGGAGIFRPEVTAPFNISHPVIAWGLGVDRLYMVKRGINDIRDLFTQKLDWLRSVPLV